VETCSQIQETFRRRRQVQECFGGRRDSIASFAEFLEANRRCGSALPLPEEFRIQQRQKRIKSSDERRIISAKKSFQSLSPMTVSHSDEQETVPMRNVLVALTPVGVGGAVVEEEGAPTASYPVRAAADGYTRDR